MRRRVFLLGVVASAMAMVAAVPASSAPQVTTYSRLAATGIFHYDLDYGSNPDSVWNGTYQYDIFYRINSIVVFDGRRITALNGLMLVDGRVRLDHDLTQWRSPDSRVPYRCKTPGSRGGSGRSYARGTNGGRFSQGGGVGVSSSGVSVNPGRVIDWSIECSATEQLENHGLQGGPGFVVPAPPKSLFTGTKAFSISCNDSYRHGWDPAAGVADAHTFDGSVIVKARFTPFPASELSATKKRLRDRVGKPISDFPGVHKECP